MKPKLWQRLGGAVDLALTMTARFDVITATWRTIIGG